MDCSLFCNPKVRELKGIRTNQIRMNELIWNNNSHLCLSSISATSPFHLCTWIPGLFLSRNLQSPVSPHSILKLIVAAKHLREITLAGAGQRFTDRNGGCSANSQAEADLDKKKIIAPFIWKRSVLKSENLNKIRWSE